MQIRAFSLPLADAEIDQRVAENWPQLNLVASLPELTAKGLLPSLACWPDIESYGADVVWQAIRRRAEQESDADAEASELDLRIPEWQAFIRPTTIELPDFTTKKETSPAPARIWLQEVVLVPRLREVSALHDFTRIDSPEWDILSTNTDRIVPISRDLPTWVPCAQTRGEGIFLRFNEDRLAAWERTADVKAREKLLQAGHDKWSADRRLDPGGWPDVRYVLLHTFAHALIREFALECGYSASGIAERTLPLFFSNTVPSSASAAAWAWSVAFVAVSDGDPAVGLSNSPKANISVSTRETIELRVAVLTEPLETAVCSAPPK